MRHLLILLCALSLGSCVVYDAWDFCESAKEGELRFVYPDDSRSPIADEIKVEHTHLPTVCREFYNDGTGRWAKCMGVGPK